MIETLAPIATVPVLTPEQLTLLPLPLTKTFATNISRHLLRDVLHDMHAPQRQEALSKAIYQFAEEQLAHTSSMIPIPPQEEEHLHIQELIPPISNAATLSAAEQALFLYNSFGHKLYRTNDDTYCLLLQDTQAPEQTLSVVFTQDIAGIRILEETIRQAPPLILPEIQMIAKEAMQTAQEKIIKPAELQPAPITVPLRRGRYEKGPTTFIPQLEKVAHHLATSLNLEEPDAIHEAVLTFAKALVTKDPRRMEKMLLGEALPLTKLGPAKPDALITRIARRLPQETIARMRELVSTKHIHPDLFVGYEDVLNERGKRYCLILKLQDKAYTFVYKRGKNGITPLRTTLLTNLPGARKLSPFDYATIALYNTSYGESVEYFYRRVPLVLAEEEL